jgi:hypothetical protein
MISLCMIIIIIIFLKRRSFCCVFGFQFLLIRLLAFVRFQCFCFFDESNTVPSLHNILPLTDHFGTLTFLMASTCEKYIVNFLQRKIDHLHSRSLSLLISFVRRSLLLINITLPLNLRYATDIRPLSPTSHSSNLYRIKFSLLVSIQTILLISIQTILPISIQTILLIYDYLIL